MRLFYKKFSAVLVIPSQGLEVGRIHPEQEIVREHGVIVLEGAGHLALAHSCHIQPDGVHAFDVRHGHEIEQVRDAEIAGCGADRHAGNVELSIYVLFL